MVMLVDRYLPPVAPGSPLAAYMAELEKYSGGYHKPSVGAIGRYGDTGAPIEQGPRSYDINTILQEAPVLQRLRQAAIDAQSPEATKWFREHPFADDPTMFGGNSMSGNWSGGGYQDAFYMSDHPYGASINAYAPISSDYGDYSVPDLVNGHRQVHDLWNGSPFVGATTDLQVINAENKLRQQELANAQDDGGFFGAITNMLPAIGMSFIPGAGFVAAGQALGQGNIPGALMSGLGAGLNLSGFSPSDYLSNALGTGKDVSNVLSSAAQGGLGGGLNGALGGALGSVLDTGSTVGNNLLKIGISGALAPDSSQPAAAPQPTQNTVVDTGQARKQTPFGNPLDSGLTFR